MAATTLAATTDLSSLTDAPPSRGLPTDSFASIPKVSIICWSLIMLLLLLSSPSSNCHATIDSAHLGGEALPVCTPLRVTSWGFASAASWW